MAMHQSRPKSMTECSGPECKGCMSAECMAGGGKVRGVHRSEGDEDDIDYGRPGQSKVGADIKGNYTPKSTRDPDVYEKHENAKVKERSVDKHHQVLGELTMQKRQDRSGMGYAEGGEVGGGPLDRDWSGYSKGPYGSEEPGEKSGMGGSKKIHLDPGKVHAAKEAAVMASMKLKNRKPMAEGGQIEGEGEHEDHEGHEELRHTMGGELMDALERKDKKGIMDALEAVVLSIKGRHE